jgi:hypothetical protein
MSKTQMKVNPSQHDGSTVTLIGSGLESYTAIRVTNRVGSIHLSGLAFTPSIGGTEGTGMVHSAQIADVDISSLAPKASPSFAGKVYSTGAFYMEGNRSVIRGSSQRFTYGIRTIVQA